MSETRELEAGRDLDAAVAERVFGAVVNRAERDGWTTFDDAGERLYLPGSKYGDHVVPDYSTDIAAAWTVVEMLREQRRGEAEMRQVFSLAHYYTAEQVAAAICRAALTAVATTAASRPGAEDGG